MAEPAPLSAPAEEFLELVDRLRERGAVCVRWGDFGVELAAPPPPAPVVLAAATPPTPLQALNAAERAELQELREDRQMREELGNG